jgi:tRNA (guanine37-N1)-methyltransferase
MAYTPTKQKTPNIRFWIVTLFPEVCEPYLTASIVGRAVGTNFIGVYLVNPRDCARDKHRTVDDRPFGGGPGMVMLAEPILIAVDKIQKEIAKIGGTKTLVILTSPGGEILTNTWAENTITEQYSDIVILCGRYEGIDSRVQEILGAQALSIGDYVLTGGELPAMVIVDVITRRIPGVLPKSESIEENRVSSHAMYTKPAILEWAGAEYSVPDVLRSGNHAEIDKWRAINE